jgi:TolB protein
VADLQFPRVSPDGSNILYQARLADQNTELRVADAASMATKAIYKTSDAPPVTFFMTAEWSPDGTEIVFVGKTGENSQIFVMNADGSDARAITAGEHPDFSPTFSNDGKEIFFSRDFYGIPKIYRMNVDGSEVKPLTSKGES